MDYFSTLRIPQVEKHIFFVMPKKPELSAADKALRESIGAAIRLACATRSRKPADIAIAGGVSLAQQYRIEGGEATPDALYLVKVAKHFGVTIDALIHPESQSPRPSGTAKDKDSDGSFSIGSNSPINQVNTEPGSVQIIGKGNVVMPRK
jgi:transcriptional regulator with XRE-family HTH domain